MSCTWSGRRLYGPKSSKRPETRVPRRTPGGAQLTQPACAVWIPPAYDRPPTTRPTRTPVAADPTRPQPAESPRPALDPGPGPSGRRARPRKVRKILPALTCRALTGTDIEVYGDGTQISDCVYVEDVARAFVEALEHTAEHGPTERPVEVGPLTSVTVNDIARLVADYAAEITAREPVGVKHLPMRPGEVPNAVVSSDTSTLAQIGMTAADFVPLDEGIRRTVDYYATEWLPGYLAA
ncbi:NAD-dependent epimerase/dehydratase family protein [Streptomyces sp. NPDC012510]|uniref:NAD-dependent epimerase/dehydratase family protein n=1 Tax=Streptomyces sp. NPDC012510 TaxID=3364838 RepID=UPI0036EAA9E0